MSEGADRLDLEQGRGDGEPIITNCHVHTFTGDHVPERFLPFGLMSLLRIERVRRFLAVLGVLTAPIIRDGRVQRFLQFADVANCESQGEILDKLRHFYPRGTRFVVLPMDMEFMGAGRPRRVLDEQHEELLELAVARWPKVVPFCAVDPRRPDIVEKTKVWIERGFCGIKIYPALGYYPTDEKLMQIYAFAEQHDVPVMTHCSTGGVSQQGLSKERAEQYLHPSHYGKIAEEFPELRICLAHFGGYGEWHKYRKQEARSEETRSWISIIADLLRQYPNLYTDISYTMFRFRQNLPVLKIFLTDERVRSSVLFGSDYYMIELERLTEREVSIELRAALGEDLFWQMANENPHRYLGERCLERLGAIVARESTG